MAAVVTLDHPEIPAISDRPRGAPASFCFRTGSIAMDGDYPTGGEALAAAAFGLDEILWCSIAPEDGVLLEYDYTNHKVLAWIQNSDGVADSAFAEAANHADLSSITAAHFVAIGVLDIVSEIPSP